MRSLGKIVSVRQGYVKQNLWEPLDNSRTCHIVRVLSEVTFANDSKLDRACLVFSEAVMVTVDCASGQGAARFAAF
jgi:hypothetical protein